MTPEPVRLLCCVNKMSPDKCPSLTSSGQRCPLSFSLAHHLSSLSPSMTSGKLLFNLPCISLQKLRFWELCRPARPQMSPPPLWQDLGQLLLFTSISSVVSLLSASERTMFVAPGRSSPLHNKPALSQTARLAPTRSSRLLPWFQYGVSVYKAALTRHLKSRSNVHNTHTISCQRLSHHNVRDTGARWGPDYFDVLNWWEHHNYPTRHLCI